MTIFIIQSEGSYGLTSYGYAALAILAILSLAAVAFFGTKKEESISGAQKTKRLAFSAMAIALAFAASYIKLFRLPFGGSVTLFSMLFVTLVGYWYGLGAGLAAAFTYSLLQFIQGPYILNFWQVGFDYLFAFTALGLSGIFHGRKNGLIYGYITAVLARGLLHSIGGYLFFMDYIPDNFPQNLAGIYPLVYNYSYILAEALITTVVFAIPAIKNAMERVKSMAQTQ